MSHNDPRKRITMGIAVAEKADAAFPSHDHDVQERVLCYQGAIVIVEGGGRIYKLTPESGIPGRAGHRALEELYGEDRLVSLPLIICEYPQNVSPQIEND